jgi:hypothetical protein
MVQGDSLARDPKLLSIKNYVIGDNDLKIYIRVPGTMHNSMDPHSHDILDSSSDLYLSVFRIPTSQQL